MASSTPGKELSLADYSLPPELASIRTKEDLARESKTISRLPLGQALLVLFHILESTLPKASDHSPPSQPQQTAPKTSLAEATSVRQQDEMARSLVLSGLSAKVGTSAESDAHDKDIVTQLCETLDVSINFVHYRLSRTILHRAPPLMKVIFPSRHLCAQFVKALPKLRTSTRFPKLSVRPSLSPEDRQKHKALMMQRYELLQKGESVYLSLFPLELRRRDTNEPVPFDPTVLNRANSKTRASDRLKKQAQSGSAAATPSCSSVTLVAQPSSHISPSTSIPPIIPSLSLPSLPTVNPDSRNVSSHQTSVVTKVAVEQRDPKNASQ